MKHGSIGSLSNVNTEIVRQKQKIFFTKKIGNGRVNKMVKLIILFINAGIQ
tara:strand:- start:1634 stop:1786 length:153 start_codon:yes stop_codon:yes gene_type:complete